MSESGHVEIICVMDRSGSMGAVEADAIGGFNKFLREQKKESGRARFSLVLFNQTYELLCDGLDLQQVPELDSRTYAVGGMTALLDAVGTAVDTARTRIAAMPQQERPTAVLVAILTDGLENSSREYTRERVFELINEQRQKHDWEFIFLAAEQDAISEGRRMGVREEDSYNFRRDSEDVQRAYREMSSRASLTRRRARRRRKRTSEDEDTPIGFKKPR